MLQLVSTAASQTQTTQETGTPAVWKEEKRAEGRGRQQTCINDNKMFPEIKQFEKLAEKSVKTLMSLPSPPPAPPTFPTAQDPMSAPRAIGFCPSDTTAGLLSSSPQLSSPAWPCGSPQYLPCVPPHLLCVPNFSCPPPTSPLSALCHLPSLQPSVSLHRPSVSPIPSL